MLTFQQESHSIEAKEIAPLERPGAVRHLRHIHPAAMRGPDQRADARTGDDSRLDAQFLQGAKDPDMREALQTATAQDERDLVRLSTRLAGRESRETARSVAGH